MQILVNISEEDYESMKKHDPIPTVTDGTNAYNAIVNGILLPKGHGKLIDADELRCEREDFDTYFDYSNVFDEIDNALTIIPADKEVENEKSE